MATLKQNSEALRAITDKLKSLPKKNELVELEVTESGVYVPPENADGFSKVTVAFENKLDALIEGTLTELSSAATSVRSRASNHNMGLAKATFPNALTVGSSAFEYCSNLVNVDFPIATKIETSAFASCSKLENANIPNATSIGTYAFNLCKALRSANFPKLTQVQDRSFASCNFLASINIPEATSVGSYSFYQCYYLTRVELPKATAIADQAFGSCSRLEEVDIPNVTYIGGSTFSNCEALVNAIIPKVTSIGTNAFAGCTLLKNITLPETLKTLGDDSFYGCSSLESIVIPDSVSGAIQRCFYQCSALKDVTVSKNITELNNRTFGYTSLNTLIMRSETAPTLASTAFYGAKAPNEILVPIGSGATYKAATNWSAYADKIVESEEAGGTIDNGNWLFQNEQISGMTLTGLPAPVIGNSYTCFVDGEEIATARCEEKWDGTPYISFSTEDYRVWLLYDTTVGDTDWYFNPMDSQVQSGSVSIRININGGGTND